MERHAATVGKSLYLEEAVKTWAASADGKRCLLDALSRAASTNEQLQAASMVDRSRLWAPLNV